jgi:hypothetical protein
MKSFNHFISERKRIGTAAPAPEPGGRDPLDPTRRRRIGKKYSDPSNPPRVKNPEATKPSSPEPIKQSDASKRQVRFRRAQRIKGATGGKPTGSLRSGNLSFPGDRSGATAKAKADLEARKGFSRSRSGGLKADEANPNVDRSVRQQRTVKQSVPDPFDPKAPKAPARPFKSVVKRIKSTASSQVPDPFKSATSVPKPKVQGPEPKVSPGPAEAEAIRNIKSQKVKTVPQTPVNKYIRTAQDAGRPVDPDFVAAQGPKASGAKPEMVGHSSSTKAERTRFRAERDAARDISRARGADLDKAVKNLVDRGTVRKPRTSFRQFSQKASAFTDAAKKFGGNQPIKPGSSPAPKSLDTSPTKPGAGYVQGNKPQPGLEVVKYQPKPKKNLFQRLTGAQPKPKSTTPLSPTEVVSPDTKLPQFDPPKAEPKGPKVTSDAARSTPRGSTIPTGVQAGARRLLKVGSVVGTGVDAAAEFKRVKDSGGNVGDAALASGTRVLGGWKGAAAGAKLGGKIGMVLGPKGAAVGGLVGGGIGYVTGAGLASGATDIARSAYKGSSSKKPVSYNANSVGQRGEKGGLTDAQLDKLMSVQRAKRKRMQSKP